MISFARKESLSCLKTLSESFRALHSSGTTSSVPHFSQNSIQLATRPNLFVQAYLRAQIYFSHNSKRFGKMNTFMKFNFGLSVRQFSLMSYRFLKNHQNFHENCLTERPKYSFMKNQNFPTHRMHFAQIFWNYGKSRSELGDKPVKSFWLKHH